VLWIGGEKKKERKKEDAKDEGRVPAEGHFVTIRTKVMLANEITSSWNCFRFVRQHNGKADDNDDEDGGK
jgi:hypothetical protein